MTYQRTRPVRSPTYDSRACSTKRVVNKGSLEVVLAAEPALSELSDGDLIQEWENHDQELRHNGHCEDREATALRQKDIEAEWEKRYPGIPINEPDPPPVTVEEVMREAGLTRSAANRRLRLGLPRDLLLCPAGKLPRGGYKTPAAERRRTGMIIRKHHLYQIAEAAAALFISDEPTGKKLIRLRNVLEAAGADLGKDAEADDATEAAYWNQHWSHRVADADELGEI